MKPYHYGFASLFGGTLNPYAMFGNETLELNVARLEPYLAKCTRRLRNENGSEHLEETLTEI